MKLNVPEGWTEKLLGELFEFKNGVNADNSSYGSGTKFINLMDIFKRNYLLGEDIEGKVIISDKMVEENLVKKGDVLFNRTSETPDEIGMTSVYLDCEEVVFGGFVIRGRPINEELYDSYKKYCFLASYVRKEIIRRGQGAVRANIGQRDLNKVILMLPPIDEQKKIALILESWDLYIEKMEKKIALKKSFKRGLMQQLLSGKVRFEEFRKNALEIRKLKGLLREVSERNRSLEYDRVLSVTNLDGFVVQTEHFDKVVASTDVSNYKVIRKGQFGYNPSRVNVGSIARLNNYDNGILSPMYVFFETKEDELLPEYMEQFITSYNFLGKVRCLTQGSVRDSLDFGSLEQIKLFVPSIKEQKKIADFLFAIDEEIKALKDQRAALKIQKKGLMQRLLTGEVRVKV